MTQTIAHCDRPWWKRPPTWFIAIAALLLAIFVIVETYGRAPTTPYGEFLDQLAAGNVAGVTLQGTEINGRFKQPVGDTSSSGAAQRDVFRSRVPDFGDPTLIPELRKQKVAIDVLAPSAWTWLLGRVPWPMLAILAVVLVAAFTRMLRGGPVVPGSAGSAIPGHGMGPIGTLTGLFARERPGPGAARPERDQP
jgi:ATP-dependent Zn protease